MEAVQDVFIVLVGVGLHDFYLERQKDWLAIGTPDVGWLFVGSMAALLACALSYFIGGALFLHGYVELSENSHPGIGSFLFAIASRVVFGALLLVIATAETFPKFLLMLALFASIGCLWSGVVLVFVKPKDSARDLSVFWFWLDLVECLGVLLLWYVYCECGGQRWIAVAMVLGAAISFVIDFIQMMRIALGKNKEPVAP